jgi:hypothetical protein
MHEVDQHREGTAPLDRAAGVLVGVAGCLSVGLFTLFSGASALFVVVALVGVSGDPGTIAQGARVIGFALLAAVAVVDLLLLIAWWRALRGSLVALALLAVTGIILAAMAVRVYDEYESGLERLQDWQFLLVFAVAAGVPVLMSLGAATRLVYLAVRRARAR